MEKSPLIFKSFFMGEYQVLDKYLKERNEDSLI